MCMCQCGGKKNCCGPIIPANDSAKNWRVGLWVIMGLHFVVLVLKCYLMGIFAGLTDLFALIILLLAQIRFDYCLLMVYIVTNLFETFSLIVVLGYYLQTDMGKNVPKQKEEEEKPDEGSAKAHNMSKISHHHHGKHDGITVIFRGLFDNFLQFRYKFYQERVESQAAKIASSIHSEIEESTSIMVEESMKEGASGGKGGKLTDRFGPEFIIPFICGLILFYIIASIIAWCAYRVWKGIAEDCAGGSINLTDGNILHYAIIAKREEAAIQEREEEEKARKAREAELKDDEQMAPLMEEM